MSETEADANLRVEQCPACGRSGESLRTDVVPVNLSSGPPLRLAMWCQYCGWFEYNRQPGAALMEPGAALSENR